MRRPQRRLMILSKRNILSILCSPNWDSDPVILHHKLQCSWPKSSILHKPQAKSWTYVRAACTQHEKQHCLHPPCFLADLRRFGQFSFQRSKQWLAKITKKHWVWETCVQPCLGEDQFQISIFWVFWNLFEPRISLSEEFVKFKCFSQRELTIYMPLHLIPPVVRMFLFILRAVIG